MLTTTTTGSSVSTSPYGHRPGDVLECQSLAITLRKESVIDEQGATVLRVGFRLGGGIDQDPRAAPVVYPDQGVYVTHVEHGSPADRAGLRRHDKILRVNGVDFTLVTHEQAVKTVKHADVLEMLVARPNLD